MTTSLLIAALFATGAAFAMATIAATLRAYWPAVLALRDAVEVKPEMQDLRVTITALRVEHPGHLLRPDFSGRLGAPARGLRAAA